MVQTIVNDTLQFGNNEAENRYKSIDNAYKAMKADSSLVNNAERNDFMQVKEGENIGLFNAVADSISTGNETEAAYINTTIVDTNLIENNLKSVNDIVIAWKQGAIHNETDTATLESIGSQNPVTGGKGVYLARAALRKRIVDRGTSSSSRIASTDNKTDVKKEVSGVVVFPNPTTGIVFIQSLSPDNLISKVTVTDITSRVISETHNSKDFILKLDLSSLVAGSYSLKIEDSTGKNYMKQIVLTK